MTASRARATIWSRPAIRACQALFRGEPRGFSDTHYNAFEPRVGVSCSLNDKTIVRTSTGVFHNRVTLNDSTLLGGNPPFQPMVVVSNGSVDNPAGGGGGATDLPFAMQGQDVAFKHPTSYHVVGRHPARDPVRVHRRRHLRWAPRSVSAARAEHQSAAAGPGRDPGVNIAALRPYKGYGVIRISENAGSRYTTACS